MKTPVVKVSKEEMRSDFKYGMGAAELVAAALDVEVDDVVLTLPERVPEDDDELEA